MARVQAFLASFLVLVLVSTAAFSANGERKIRFAGKLSAEVDQRISVKDLESQFTLQTVKLYNPWEKKSAEYTGIWLKDLLAQKAQSGVTSISFKAIDDYRVKIDQATWQKYRILLVTRENGDYIGVRDKGPMRIVFPDYDASKKEYELNLPLWMWMISKIEFK